MFVITPKRTGNPATNLGWWFFLNHKATLRAVVRSRSPGSGACPKKVALYRTRNGYYAQRITIGNTQFIPGLLWSPPATPPNSETSEKHACPVPSAKPALLTFCPQNRRSPPPPGLSMTEGRPPPSPSAPNPQGSKSPPDAAPFQLHEQWGSSLTFSQTQT
jgi:hypothetical protein